MELLSRLNIFLFGLEAALLYGAYKNWRSICNKQRDENTYEVIFLSNNLLNSAKYNWNHYLHPVINFINAAKHTLDMCFYTINDNAVVSAIVNSKRERNVKIRIIVDYTAGFNNNYAANEFLKAGIQVYTVKCKQSECLLHSKFCLRDGDVVLQGSLNLSYSSASGSYDNIIITRSIDLINEFQSYFDMLIRDRKVISGLEI